MQEPSLKGLLNQVEELLSDHASELGIEVGLQSAVDGNNGYLASWPICRVTNIADVNACVENIRSLCTRLGNVEANDCVFLDPDAVCCGMVKIASHKPDEGSPVVTIFVFPRASVGQSREGLSISNPIIPLREVPGLKVAA